MRVFIGILIFLRSYNCYNAYLRDNSGADEKNLRAA